MQTYKHERCLRIGRFSHPGQSYLVTCTVKNRHPTFADVHVGRLLIGEMKRLHDSNAVHSMAWVVMPDHLHWLFELRSGSLATLMQALKGRSAFEINKVWGSKTLVWQKGYHDRAIRSEQDLLETARYVIANPIRAGVVEGVGDYSLWDCAWLLDPVHF